MKGKMLASILVGCLSLATQAAEWGYGKHNGPDEWGNISSICANGKNQSPINLTNPIQGSLEKLSIVYTGKVVGLHNNGHTLEAKVEGKNQLTVDGTTFELKQFHFHTPSENLIKSKSYPFEAHFVHADKSGNLAVVSVMYEIDSENNQIAMLSEKLPKEGQITKLNHRFSVADMLPDHHAYYRFNGSLTTPPCTEGVRWFVLENTLSLSREQEQKLHKIMGDNNRPIQNLWARKVMFNK